MARGGTGRRAGVFRDLSHTRGHSRGFRDAFAASRASPTGRNGCVDEVPVTDGDVLAAAHELARRMLAAGAADLLRDAEAMAAR